MAPSIEMGDPARAVGIRDAIGDGRRRQRVRSRRLRSIIAAAVICVLPGAWALAVRSPLVRARVIDVVGASHVTRSRALDLAGISASTNVASLDTEAAASRLEADPWIADASVERHLPWTVRIELIERTPVLAVKDGGRDRLVAGDGTFLGGARRDGGGLPLLRARPGDAGQATVRTSIDLAAAAVASIGPRGRGAIRSVSLARDGSLGFALEGGGTILYGDASDAIAKARTFAALLRWAESEGEELAFADLRVAGVPTARLRPGGTDEARPGSG